MHFYLGRGKHKTIEENPPAIKAENYDFTLWRHISGWWNQ